jgi:hypothetical protein
VGGGRRLKQTRPPPFRVRAVEEIQRWLGIALGAMGGNDLSGPNSSSRGSSSPLRFREAEQGTPPIGGRCRAVRWPANRVTCVVEL